MQAVIGKEMKDFEDRIGAITNGELARELLPRLRRRLEDQLTSTELSPETRAHLRTASDVSRQLGEFLVRNSFNRKTMTFAGLFKLNQYAGTATHETVKAIGNFLGKSFKPWEAVKWARTIANAGRVLAVVGTVLTFVLQVKEDADAARLESDLRESRSVIRAGFNDAAYVIETHYDQASSAYVATTVTTEIEEVDKQLAELKGMEQSRERLFHDLEALIEETRGMIRELHRSTT